MNIYFLHAFDKIKLWDFKNNHLIKTLEGHKGDVVTIKKFKHALYGECLISQATNDNEIKLWSN